MFDPSLSLSSLQVRLYLTDEEELEIFEELIIGETTKVCTHQLMEWVLKEILTKSVR